LLKIARLSVFICAVPHAVPVCLAEQCRIALGEQGRSIVDRFVSLSKPGVFGEPPLWREMQITYNGQILWAANAFQYR
jgi:hypothetical protein